MAGMVSPVKGYVTSEYGTRSGTLHAGIDIATGGVAAPVYAAYAGTLSNIVRGRKRYQPANVGPTVAPYRTGDGGRVHNPDGEQQVYIHMRFLDKWKNGDKVRQGELLGYVNLSGNTSGYHLHYEEWTKAGRTRNPRVSFKAFGVAVGSTPKAAAPAPKPKPKPSAPKPKTASDYLTSSVKAKLKKMGLSQTVAGVKSYQKAHGLVQDGKWGPLTEQMYQWVIKLQKYLNEWLAVQRRYGKIAEDGYRGKITKNAEAIAKANDTTKQPFKYPAGRP